MAGKSAEYLKDQFKSLIVKNNMKPGERLPIVTDLCKSFKCSPVTAHRALSALAADGIVDCVHGKGVFIKNLDRASAMRKIGISVVMHHVSGKDVDVAFGGFFNGAEDYLRAHGKEIELVRQRNLQDKTLGKEILAGIDGMIISFSYIEDISVQLLRESGKPVVVVQHEHVMDLGLNQVIPDLMTGCEEAAKAIIKSGVGKVSVLQDSDNPHHANRNDAFKKALALCPGGKGVEVEEIVMDSVSVDLGRMTGREFGKEILRRGAKTVFSPSDFFSFGVLDVILENGQTPGKDVSLISVDDLEGQGVLPFKEGMLSSISIPRPRISVEAAKLLLSLDGAERDISTIVRIPTSLALRESFR